jgi:hypothetical protein
MANIQKPMTQVWLTREENFLIEVVRKVIWGSVEVIIKNGDIKVVKKIIETYNIEKDLAVDKRT